MAPHDPLSALIESTRSKSKGDQAKSLARLLFDKAPPEDLAGYTPDDLAELVRGRLAFLAERKPGRSKIAVTNPDGAFGDVTFIDILNDDMPFLVDSTIALLAERGLEVRLALHPVLSVKRDGQGKLAAIEDKAVPDAGTIRESYLHLHIARISDEDGRELESAFQGVFADVRMAVLDWRAMQQRLRDAISIISRIRRPSRSRSSRSRSPSCNGCSTIISPSSASANTASKAVRAKASSSPSPIAASAYCVRPTSRFCGAAKSSSPCRRKCANSSCSRRPSSSPSRICARHSPARADGLCRRQAVRCGRRTCRRIALHRPVHLVGLHAESQRYSAAAQKAAAHRRGERLSIHPGIRARR